MNYTYKQLSPQDTNLLKELLAVFGKAFQDTDSYQSAVPSDSYLQKLLSKESFIVLIALQDNKVVGGLVAYVLEKFEQERKEIYIYDLAVDENHRRKGIATQLINNLKKVAQQINAYVIYVQADHGDEPVIKLYESVGEKEEVLHFDILIK